MWNFQKGYVIIRIEGLSIAPFLKRIAESGIRIRNIRRIDDGTALFTIPANCFFGLRSLRSGLRIRMHIVRRGGLAFQLLKLKKRPILWIGSTLLLAGMMIASSRIWIIRIDDTKLVDPNEVSEQLSAHGIVPGAFLQGPILITAANDLSAQIKEAAWIGLDREGIMLKVNIVEAIPESTKKTQRIPSDIVAEKDGVITSIQVMRGQARVHVGDKVKRGDVLISGTVTYKDKSYETNADGTVRAAVIYRNESEVTDRISEAVETGGSETVRILHFGKTELMRSRPSFETYWLCDPKTVRVTNLLPITIEAYSARELSFLNRFLTETEAQENALAKATEQAYALVPHDAVILNTYGTFRTEKEQRFAVAIVTAEETIGKTEEASDDR